MTRKRFISMTLMLALLVTLFPMTKQTSANGYASSRLASLLAAQAVSLGSPIKDVQILGNHIAVNADGDTIFYGVLVGSPAIFFVYNVDTGQVLDQHLLEHNGVGSKQAYAVDMGLDGTIHIVGNPLYFQYHPDTKQLQFISTLLGETTVMAPGGVDSSGSYYVGTYPNAKLLRYNVQTAAMEDLGIMFPNEKYVKSMVVYDDHVYMGGMGNPTTKFLKYNTQTGATTVLPQPSLPGKFTSAQVTGYYAMKQTGPYIFARVTAAAGSKKYSVLAVFDLQQQQWIDVIDKGPFWFHATDLDNGIVYFHSGGGTNARILYAYDVATKTVTDTGIVTGDYIISPKIVELQDQTAYPGKTIVFGSDTSGIGLINLQTKQVSYIKDILPAQSTRIRTLAPGPGDELALSGYMGSNLVIYDTAAEHVKVTVPGEQFEALAYFDQSYYAGGYGSAQLFKYDWSNPNQLPTGPTLVSTMAGAVKQSRAFNIIDTGSHIVWGSVPDYGFHGGSIGIYEKATAAKRFVPIADQSVSGIAHRNGTLYVTTNIYGGLGDDPVQDIAKVIKINLATGAIEQTVSVELATDPNPQLFAGDIVFSPDGSRLLMATAQTLVELDPDTLDIVREMRIGSYRMSPSVPRWLPFNMHWTDNGLLLTSIGFRISAVDIDTWEAKELYDQRTYAMTLGNNGHIYFVEGVQQTELMKIELSEQDGTGGDDNEPLEAAEWLSRMTALLAADKAAGAIQHTFAVQLEARMSIIGLLLDQGQRATAIAYRDDFVRYINDASVLQQQLLSAASAERLTVLAARLAAASN